jgi:hypothetical protein
VYRVNFAGVPWADDFAALVAAMSALLRVHHVTVTRPLEAIGAESPVELLRQAREIVRMVAHEGAPLTPWPVALQQCADYASVLFSG